MYVYHQMESHLIVTLGQPDLEMLESERYCYRVFEESNYKRTLTVRTDTETDAPMAVVTGILNVTVYLREIDLEELPAKIGLDAITVFSGRYRIRKEQLFGAAGGIIVQEAMRRRE